MFFQKFCRYTVDRGSLIRVQFPDLEGNICNSDLSKFKFVARRISFLDIAFAFVALKALYCYFNWIHKIFIGDNADSKCLFAKSSVKFLGFEISDKGLLPDEGKVKAIHDYAAPTYEISLRRFLGLTSYYRRFVSGFSEIAAPLHRLLQKGSKFCLTKECDAAFEQLKAELQSSSILGFIISVYFVY